MELGGEAVGKGWGLVTFWSEELEGGKPATCRKGAGGSPTVPALPALSLSHQGSMMQTGAS